MTYSKERCSSLNRFKLSDIVVVEKDRFTKTQKTSHIGCIGIIVEIDRSKPWPLFAIQFHDTNMFPRTRLYYTGDNIRLASQREIHEELCRVLLGTDIT